MVHAYVPSVYADAMDFRLSLRSDGMTKEKI
jgi:hypothetical protein